MTMSPLLYPVELFVRDSMIEYMDVDAVIHLLVPWNISSPVIDVVCSRLRFNQFYVYKVLTEHYQCASQTGRDALVALRNEELYQWATSIVKLQAVSDGLSVAADTHAIMVGDDA